MNEVDKWLVSELVSIVVSQDPASEKAKQAVKVLENLRGRNEQARMVLGAREGNLGDEIAALLNTDLTFDLRTSSPERQANIHDMNMMEELLIKHRPEVLVVSAGVNLPDQRGDWAQFYRNTEIQMIMSASTLSVVNLWMATSAAVSDAEHVCVVVSSNSAAVPRAGSAGYCASKAAVSHGMRSLAREASKDPNLQNVSLVTVEPGLIIDTPMTQQWTDKNPGVAPSRTPSPAGTSAEHLTKRDVARLVKNIVAHPRAYHGATIRMDRGEQ